MTLNINDTYPRWCAPMAWAVFVMGNSLLYMNAKLDVSIGFLDRTGLRSTIWPQNNDGFNYAVNSVMAVGIAVLFLCLIGYSRLGRRHKIFLMIVVPLFQSAVAAFCWVLWQFGMGGHH